MTGYLHRLYAKSLSEFGTPVELPQCGGRLLERAIPNSDLKDAIGCYPLFCCTDWTKVPADIQQVKHRYVTISVVPDPFAPITAADLSQYFQLVKPFKKHFIIDASNSSDQHITRHHQYYARRALKQMRVRLVDDPKTCLDEWGMPLPNSDRASPPSRHQGLSKTAFAGQFELTGTGCFSRAKTENCRNASVVYSIRRCLSHLGASDQEGALLGAAYALHWSAINEFQTASRRRGSLDRSWRRSRREGKRTRWSLPDLSADGPLEKRSNISVAQSAIGKITGCCAGTDQINSGYFRSIGPANYLKEKFTQLLT
jgi:hypothetical protein